MRNFTAPPPPRVVLLGAGASADAGIPTAATMLPIIRRRLAERPAWPLVATAFDSVLGALQQVQAIRGTPFAYPDVETFFAALELLAERHFSPLAPFVASWSPHVAAAERPKLDGYVRYAREMLERDLGSILGDVTAGHISGFGDPLSHRLKAFEQALAELIGAAVGGEPHSFRDAANLILELLPEICWIRDASKVAYLSPLVVSARHQRLWIATLNFDNTIEAAAAAAGIAVDNGLNASGGGSIRFVHDSPLALAKLHGSLNWALEDPWYVSVKPEPTSNSRAVFGAANKLRVDGPYLDLLLAFREALNSADTLEVCGYSFRDSHVNHTILRWLNFGDSHRLVVVDRNLSIERLIDNIDANIGIELPTRQKVRTAPEWIKKRIDLRSLSASEWVRTAFPAPAG
jgi:SIR2-like protein